MRVLGAITILISVVAMLLAAGEIPQDIDGVRVAVFLIALLALILGQNCIVIGRVQARLQTAESRLAKVDGAIRAQQSTLSSLATEHVDDELRERGLLGGTGTGSEENMGDTKE